MKLNLGCGQSKLEGFINVDAEISNEPDLLLDFVVNPLPYDDGVVDEIFLFHVIEHIPESRHSILLTELHRVLKPEGRLVVSYPEFTRCAQNYIMNYRGQREFWKNTIYGLQRYPSDFHVALMDSAFFLEKLADHGFVGTAKPEVGETYNTIVTAHKASMRPSYEDILRHELFE